MGQRKPRKGNQVKGKFTAGKRGKEVEINLKDKDVNMADLKSHDNDYTWYTKYPTLFKNVTGVNFGTQVGSQIRWNPSLTGADPNIHNAAAAGICAIHYIPTLGAADATLDTPSARVAAQMYSAMRMKLGSTASYDATDIMLYLGAMDSAYSLYGLGAKIYGILRVSSPFNNYLLENMATANCVDYASFADNLSNFRSKLNQFAIFLSSRLVPASFDILKRHIWLITNMFTDAETAKAQIYTLVMDGYYTYNEVTQGPGYLKFNAFKHATDASQLLTFNDWVTALNNVYETLMGSSDIDQMSADIGKAFDGDTFTLELIPEEYITPISYSKEVLTQIENCVLCGKYLDKEVTEGSVTYHSSDIYQAVSLPQSPRLKQQMILSLNATITAGAISTLHSAFISRKMLNFHWMNPTQEDIIVSTRGIPGSMSDVQTSDIANSYVLVNGYGSEVYTYASTYTLNRNYKLDKIDFTYAQVMAAEAMVNLLSAWGQFDWAPTFFAATAATSPVLRYYCDIDNYAMVDWIQLRDMNTNAVLSEFYSDKFPQVLN